MTSPEPFPLATHELRHFRTGPTGRFPMDAGSVQEALRRNIPRKAMIEVEEPGRLRWRIPHMTFGTIQGYTVELQVAEAGGQTIVRSGGGIPRRGIQLVDLSNDVGRGAARVMKDARKELKAGEVEPWLPIGFLVFIGFLLLLLAQTVFYRLTG